VGILYWFGWHRLGSRIAPADRSVGILAVWNGFRRKSLREIGSDRIRHCPIRAVGTGTIGIPDLIGNFRRRAGDDGIEIDAEMMFKDSDQSFGCSAAV
jgi:hypothetical protein